MIEDLITKALAKGSDSQYRRWINRQPSCLSNRFSEYLESGEGRSIACHVRRANESGTGYKASFACVPLSFHEHHRQHTQAESGLLSWYWGREVSEEEAAEWFDRKRVEYLKRWVDS